MKASCHKQASVHCESTVLSCWSLNQAMLYITVPFDLQRCTLFNFAMNKFDVNVNILNYFVFKVP